MSLYFNVFFFPIWLITVLLMLQLKVIYFIFSLYSHIHTIIGLDCCNHVFILYAAFKILISIPDIKVKPGKHIAPAMSTDVSQVGVALFASF